MIFVRAGCVKTDRQEPFGKIKKLKLRSAKRFVINLREYQCRVLQYVCPARMESASGIAMPISPAPTMGTIQLLYTCTRNTQFHGHFTMRRRRKHNGEPRNHHGPRDCTPTSTHATPRTLVCS